MEAQLKGHNGWVVSVVSDNQYVYTAGYDKSIIIWNVKV